MVTAAAVGTVAAAVPVRHDVFLQTAASAPATADSFARLLALDPQALTGQQQVWLLQALERAEGMLTAAKHRDGGAR